MGKNRVGFGDDQGTRVQQRGSRTNLVRGNIGRGHPTRPQRKALPGL
jgi:hypothetical protein